MVHMIAIVLLHPVVPDGEIREISAAGDPKVVLTIVNTILSGNKDLAAKFEHILAYIASSAGSLIDEKQNKVLIWTDPTVLYPPAFVPEGEAQGTAETSTRRAAPGAADVRVDEDDEEGEDLCNCIFSLAYGAKILLKQMHQPLNWGQHYRLCGLNDSGKSTLMRATNYEQVEGFPKKTDVMIFVERDPDSADTEKAVVGWTFDKLAETGPGVSVEDLKTNLGEFRFLETMFDAPVTSPSDGCKMKLPLIGAVFDYPDILLLDEPTSHIDSHNVKWLERYLVNSPCTSVIVSHDSGFLDNVVQHIIHYEHFKLRCYRGK